jgi:hypothetical protein
MKIKSAMITLIICSSIYFSCSSDIPGLSEYQGVNYLKSSGLKAPDWDINTKAKSDFLTASFNYMIFDKAPATSNMVYTGLPGNTDSGDISRLEVPNLATNGGFENSFSLPATGWTALGTTAVDSADSLILFPLAGVHPNATPVNNSLFLKFPDKADSLSFDLLTISDTFYSTIRYTLRFNFKKEKQGRMNLKFDGRPWTPVIQTAWTETEYETFHESIIKGADNRFLFLHNEGDSTDYSSCIDDFQVIRNEIDYYINNIVSFNSDVRPVLYSGVYRFSVFLKAEDNDDINTLASNYRVRTSAVILEIKDKRKAATSIFKYKTDYSGAETSETAFTKNRWTELYVDKFIQIDNEDDTIELRIYPVDPTGSHNTLEAGSVLIANPKLYYISE